MSAVSLAAARAASPARLRVLRKVCSFPVTLAGLLTALAVLTVRSRFNDPDMWWHLKTGEIIWTTHTIPTTDLFSYTTHHHSWIPHEWLSQWLIYGAYRLGGYSGLMLWLCFFTAALLIAGYALCSLYSANAKVGFLGAMLLWLFATSGLAIRPQMIGYLLLIVELLLLHLGRARSPRWFLGLPPLFAVWVNCHGSFIFGFFLMGVFLACSFCDFELGLLVSSRWPSRHRRMLTLALILSAAALFLNPIGVKQVLYPLNLMLKQPLNLGAVEEWQPLQFSGARGLGFLLAFAGTFLLVIVQRSKLSCQELALLATGAWLAASHRRLIFVFGILAAPILSRLLANWWEGYDAERDRPWPNAVFVILSLLIVFWAFPNPQSLARQVEQKSPVKAVEFIQAHHLSGRMLNEYAFGGYLIWAAPDHPVFVDGRTDIFEWTGILSDFGRWATLESDPNSLLNRYGIDFCLLSRNSPMARVLPLLPGWKAVYSDNLSEIFVRAAAGSPLQ